MLQSIHRSILIAIALLLTYAVYGESRIKIAVLDTGVFDGFLFHKWMCRDGIQSVMGDYGLDKHGHGSNVAALIGEQINIKTHCVKSYKVFSDDLRQYKLIKGLKEILKDKQIKYVNLSISGPGVIKGELEAIRALLKRGIKVIVAAGNHSYKLDEKSSCNIYPACHNFVIKDKNFWVVGSNTGKYSNTGKVVDGYVDGTEKGIGKMSGSSQSAAIFTGRLVRSGR